MAAKGVQDIPEVGFDTGVEKTEGNPVLPECGHSFTYTKYKI